MNDRTPSPTTDTRVAAGPVGRYLAFHLGKESYAVELLKVREVIALCETTPVPYTPPHFRGIINLRGQLISIVDLKMKFGMPGSAPTGESAIIILDLAPLSLGVIVDSVDSVLGVTADDVNPPPDCASTPAGHCITGVARKNKQLVLLLDIAKALDGTELDLIRTQGAGTAGAGTAGEEARHAS